MKTIRERAQELHQQIFNADNFQKEIELIIEAFKEQDKITHHACVENLNSVESETITDLRTDQVQYVIDLEVAKQAIMNTKAV